MLTAEALTDPQLLATASNVCTTDAMLGGDGQVPQTKILATQPLFVGSAGDQWPVAASFK